MRCLALIFTLNIFDVFVNKIVERFDGTLKFEIGIGVGTAQPTRSPPLAKNTRNSNHSPLQGLHLSG